MVKFYVKLYVYLPQQKIRKHDFILDKAMFKSKELKNKTFMQVFP